MDTADTSSTSTSFKTATVRVAQVEGIIKKAEAIHKIAQKYGESFWVRVTRGPYRYECRPSGGTPYFIEYCDIQYPDCHFGIQGGWAVIGAAKTVEGSEANVVFGEVPEEMKHGDLECAHCGRSIQKAIIMKDSNGDIKAVGVGCMKKYAGVDGDSVLNGFKERESLLNVEESRGTRSLLERVAHGVAFRRYASGHSHIIENMEAFKDYIWHGVSDFFFKRHSWAVKTSDKECCDGRPDEVDSFDAIFKDMPQEERIKLYSVNENDYSIAEKAIEYARSLPESEVAGERRKRNAWILAQVGVMKGEYFGGCWCGAYAMCILELYEKFIGVNAEEFIPEQLPDIWEGQQVGEEGDKVSLNVSEGRVADWQWAYRGDGKVFYYEWKTEDGKIVVWKTNKEFDPSTVKSLTGTVKCYCDYKKDGRKTYLLRCKCK